ncbi:MAG TPA: hypothetical protein VFR58_07565 [Flavisolibacter sp.]|nr:hypothetical protein [Flavisolibacter sp.]
MRTRYNKAILASVLLAICIGTNAQRVGIGTSNPLRKLSVTGSIMVDQNSNNTGTLDSAALVFGNAGLAGISSKQNAPTPHDLTFWTAGVANMHLSSTGNLGIGGPAGDGRRLTVRNGSAKIEGELSVDENIYGWGDFTHTGRAGIGGPADQMYRLRVWGTTYVGGGLQTSGHVGIGGEIDPDYKLRVWNGNSRFGGDLYATGNAAFGGAVDNDYRLKVYGGSTLLDGDLRATGKMSVGGTVDNNFRFRVYGGNSRFGGNVEITGDVTAANVDVSNSLTVGGKGSVRSNGSSPLRIGFDQRSINVVIPANEAVAVVADITDFSGDNDDVRVFVSQFAPGGAGTLLWPNIIVSISSVNAANDTCVIWLHNRSGSSGTLTGTLYLTTIAKN